MTIKISSRDHSSLFRPVEPSQTIKSPNEYLEALYEYPKEFGKGYVLNIKLREGFWLSISDYQRHEYLILDSPEWQHPLQFGFQISGGVSSYDNGTIRSGESLLCGCGMSPRVLYESLSLEPDKAIDIHIQPEVFKSFVGIENGDIPSQLQHLFRKPEQRYYVNVGIITIQQQVALQQIWQCPYKGIVKRMYLESKVLELMALQLQQEMELEVIHHAIDTLKRDRVDRIYQAKDILEHQLDCPPSILELAEQVGLNHHQLKQGFRQVFGTTVFGYLHQYRMEQARLLLREGNMNVADVATTVGYSHLGHFAAAFKRKFGISPSDCLKGRKFNLA